MANWTSIPTSVLEIGKPVRSIDIIALRDNIIAVTEKAAGAPVLANGYIVSAMMAAASVSEGALISSSVSQGKIKLATGDVSIGTGGSSNFTLPGGSYGFYVQTWASGSGGGTSAQISIANTSTIPINNIHLIETGGVAGTAHARQPYISTSPPYNLGDGEIPIFVFVIVDSLGNVVATYVAEDPPWAYNGPTSTIPDFIGPDGKQYQIKMINGQRTEVELTQAIKQADMSLIPHPFVNNDLTGKTVTLLDPMSTLVRDLRDMNRAGESVSSLLHNKFLILDNTPLLRMAPSGVMPINVSWRRT